MAEEKCSNCRRFIPSASYQLHVVHCARNMVLCKQCDEPIPRSEFEDHMEECPMTKVECVCGKMIEKCKLETHKAEECPKRTTLCKWCATHVEMGNLEEHEDYCGSRTEKCEKCGEFIMLKNFETHLQTNCAPKPSWERKSSIVSSTPSYSSYTSSIKPSTITDSATSIPTPSYDAYSSSRRFSSSTISATSALRRSSSISRVTSSGLSRSATAAEVVTNSIVTDNNSSDDVVMIPCEFCDKPISSTKLLSHQAECVNPTNVRSVASTSTSNTSSSYTSRFTRASSISRSYSLTSTNSSSKIHKQVQQTETANTTSDTSSVNSRKTLATSSSSSIVNRYLSSPEPKTNGSKKYLPESPPSYEKDFGSSSYVGRSSYLVEESRREDRSSYSSYKSTETKTREKTEAPGMYTNDNDREGLRQMLSSLRRDPMDVEDDPDNNDGSFFPCEFCGDPYPCEFLMRHQISCDLNPQPVSSGSGFDYSAIKRNIGDHLGVPEPSYNRRRTSATSNGNSSSSNGDAGEQYTSNSRESRRLSRSNSVIERSYSRSNVRASSVSRTSSFADRSYGTRTNLARQSSFTLQDYSNAARRSSIFDGVAGYSIYSSISEGLDQITYGGRGTSRRNSITESSTNYSLSRQGSFSTRNSQVPISALMASMEANKVSKDENTAVANNHINSQANAYLQNGHTNGFSRQNSRNNNETVDSPFGVTKGHHSNVEIQRSESSHLRRRSSLKHSDSGYKLERKVSFHHRDQIIGATENGVDGEKKEKKKRTKEEKEARRKEKEEKRARKEAKRAAREMSVDRRPEVQAPVVKNHPQGEALLEQVSYKLANLQSPVAGDEGGSGRGCGSSLPPPPSSSLLPDYNAMQAAQASRKLPSAPNTASSVNANTGKTTTTTFNIANGSHEDSHNNDVVNKQLIVKSETSSDKPRKGPAPQPPVVNDLVNLDESSSSSVVLREHNEDRTTSRSCSNRNSLDNKSVASLAKDLAAECAKAYELMESSLSKLTNDFSIGPFGLTPKTKKKFRGPPAPPMK